MGRLWLADETRRVVRIPSASVLRDGGVNAERPRELDGPGCRLVVGELGRHDLAGWNVALDPILERRLEVVLGVSRGRHLLSRSTEIRGAGPTRAVVHAGHHIESVEVMRGLQTSAGADHLVVVLGAIGGLKRLVGPSVILDNLHA